MLAEARCKDCNGEGWNGTIGPYRVVCLQCLGRGWVLRDYKAIINGELKD